LKLSQISVALALIGASLGASAADLAVLRNGNSIRHERREVVGAVTRLYLGDTASGYIEIPTDQIERFEKDTAPPPAKTQSSMAGTGFSTQPPRVSNPFASAAQPQPAATLTRQGLTDVINGAGERHQIDPDFINSVIRAESGFHQHAVSKKGAQGLMQLMPGTASQLGVNNAFDPRSNVEGGTTYLRALLEKYNYDVPKALAAYNAGPGRVDKYRGVPPYYETEAYIARIIRDFNRRKIAENPALAKKAKSAPTRTSSSAQHLTHAAAIANGVPRAGETVSK
jgi:Transglycosylase SLT domain